MVACFCILVCAAAALEHPADGGGALRTDRDKASYAFGMNIGRAWRLGHLDLDPSGVARGLTDELDGGATLLSEREMTAALAAFDRERKAKHLAGATGADASPGPSIAPPQSGPFASERARVSYAFGMNLGQGWKAGFVDLDPATTVRGLQEALTGGPTQLTESAMNDALAKFGRDLRAVQTRHREAMAVENLHKGEAFLAQNRFHPGVVTLPSGLQYQVIAPGAGERPTLANWVQVAFRGTRIDGTEVASSDAHPESGIVCLGSVTEGWQEALQMMKPGAQWRIFVPSSLGYGSDGSPGVAPNEVLVYDLHLLSILPGQPQPTAEDIKNEREPDGD
jgi:FKBP-type peptidyl-prolyl cis-trans isomerase FklB